jgi:hypothetical protein
LDLYKAIFADSTDEEDMQENVVDPPIPKPVLNPTAPIHSDPSASIVDQPFRPVFTKPIRKEPLNQRRKKKTRPAPTTEVPTEERAVKRKLAADYMD